MMYPPTPPPTYLDHDTALAYLLRLTNRTDVDGDEREAAIEFVQEVNGLKDAIERAADYLRTTQSQFQTFSADLQRFKLQVESYPKMTSWQDDELAKSVDVHVRATQSDFQSFLASFRQRRSALRDSYPEGHVLGSAVVVSLSMDIIHRDVFGVGSLLEMSSIIPVSPIPEEFAPVGGSIRDYDFDPVSARRETDLLREQQLALLADYSLIHRDMAQRTYEVDPLAKTLMQKWIDKNELDYESIVVIQTFFAFSCRHAEPEVQERLLPIAQYCADHRTALSFALMEAIVLMFDAARCLYRLGRYLDALPMYRQGFATYQLLSPHFDGSTEGIGELDGEIDLNENDAKPLCDKAEVIYRRLMGEPDEAKNPLDHDTALAYLLQLTNRTDVDGDEREAAIEFVQEVDSSETAIELAAANLRATHSSFRTFLDKFQQRVNDMNTAGLDEDLLALCKIVFLSLEDIGHESQSAVELLCLVVWAHFSCIPDVLAPVGGSKIDHDTDAVSTGRAMALLREQQLSLLADYALIHRDTEQRTFEVTHTVQAVLKFIAYEPWGKDCILGLIVATLEAFAANLTDADVMRRLLPVAIHCAEQIAASPPYVWPNMSAILDMALYLFEQKQYAMAEPIYRQMLTIFKNTQGFVQQEIAELIDSEEAPCRDEEEAKRFCERADMICRRAFQS
ncbi:MAG: Kinesin light chain [Capsulimonas sp.]|nr:Kinesin light chain [Capsulimonas sp.]